MKLSNLIACVIMGLFVASCIQDEALNSEAAIDSCTGADVQFTNINTNSKIVDVYVNKGADLAKLELTFGLAQGATIKANEQKTNDTDKTYDFKAIPHSRLFTVTSEDGEWQAVYNVNIIIPTELPSVFHFENLLETPDPYHVFYEFEAGTSEDAVKELQWSSGNPGYQLTFMANTVEDYPTVQVGNGYNGGKCAKLTTRDTGSFGASVKMHIAAGNLFIGTFDLTNALKDAPAATTFGLQFYKHPEILKGYYKYKAGAVYTEGGKPQSGKDKCDIYAIMYEADNNSFMLNGHNSLSSDKLISIAQMPQNDIIESDEWQEFNIPFILQPGKTIDEQKLNTGKYKLSIVLSSSVDGASFKGAVGSTLYVDELELISTEDKK